MASGRHQGSGSIFFSTITSHDFKQFSADHSLFTLGTDSSLVVLLVYVDDIIEGSNMDMIHKTKTFSRQLQSQGDC